MSYLFLFTIGPVKSFISESRKAQDLFAGSKLLSYLASIGLWKAKEEWNNKCNVITPFITEEQWENLETNIESGICNVSIPNRFLIQIDENETKNLKEVAENIKQTVTDTFCSFAQNKMKRIGVELPNGFKEQLEAHLNINYLFQQINSNDYKSAFKAINTNLASLKNQSTFEKLAETGRKCDVDGKRNIKVYRTNIKEKIEINSCSNLYNKLYQKEDDVIVLEPGDVRFKVWQIQQGEGLSAISLTKRLFQNEPHQFPSTTRVALWDLLNTYKDNEKLKKYLQLYVGEKAEGRKFNHSDDQLLYSENIERILRKNGNENSIEEVVKAHKKLSKEIDAPFTKYYALVLFDGDKMGDWFNGDFLKDGNQLKDFHIELSKAIGNFADKINVELKAPKGQAVFAGGEDFMAFVNIHHLIPTLQLIESTYNERINKKLEQRIKDDQQITLSAGVIIAHYKEPLNQVLNKVRKLEQKAKNSGRNRICIGVSKHSGGQHNALLKWNNLENLNVLLSQFEGEESEVSTAYILKILEEAQTVDFNYSKEMLLSKLKLFFSRAINDTAQLSKHLNEGINALNELYEIDIDEKFDSKENRVQKNFTELLLILDFLKRKTI